jgi:hypothetical protein
MSSIVIRSIKNALGQKIIVPDVFRSDEYIRLLRILNGTQIGLDTLDIVISGKKVSPKIRGVLPAMYKIVFAFLEENRGRKDDKGNFIKISLADIVFFLDILGVSKLYNKATLAVAFCNVVRVIRDDTSRQIDINTHRLLLDLTIKTNKNRGAGPKYYWLS